MSNRTQIDSGCDIQYEEKLNSNISTNITNNNIIKTDFPLTELANSDLNLVHLKDSFCQRIVILSNILSKRKTLLPNKFFFRKIFNINSKPFQSRSNLHLTKYNLGKLKKLIITISARHKKIILKGPQLILKTLFGFFKRYRKFTSNKKMALENQQKSFCQNEKNNDEF